jgi:hypothetical protein
VAGGGVNCCAFDGDAIFGVLNGLGEGDDEVADG